MQWLFVAPRLLHAKLSFELHPCDWKDQEMNLTGRKLSQSLPEGKPRQELSSPFPKVINTKKKQD